MRSWNVEARSRLALLARLHDPLVGIDLVRGKLEVRSAGRTIYVLDPSNDRVVDKRRAGPITARSRDAAVSATARGRVIEVRRHGQSIRLEAGAPVADVAVSTDGRLVAAAAGNDALVWAAGGGSKRVLRRHADLVRSVAFSDDGLRLVTTGRDDAVIVWRVRDGQLLYVKKPQYGVLSDARFSPNRRWIVTAGPATAGLLDARSGERQFLLDGHKAQVRGVTFDAAGRRIYTVSLDGTVRTYLCRICGGLAELEQLAKERLAVLPRD